MTQKESISDLKNMNKTVYIDLDNTLADYLGMCEEMHISPAEAKHTLGFFRKLRPIIAKIFVIDDETHSTMLLASEY